MFYVKGAYQLGRGRGAIASSLQFLNQKLGKQNIGDIAIHEVQKFYRPNILQFLLCLIIGGILDLLEKASKTREAS